MIVTAVVASLALAGAQPVDPVPATPVEVSAPVVAPAQAAAPPPASAPPEDAGNEIVVSGEVKAPPGDPMEQINAKSFEVVQKVDEKFVAPIAHGYERGVPRPVRMGLRNFIRNLTEPVVFLNFMLQLKPGKAAETVGRFGINSTVGLGGLIDVARSKPFHLPYHFNGLGNTLGYYGVGPGPYMYLPLVGPTTVRDLFGLLVDRAVVPGIVGKPLNRPTYALPMNTIESIDDRLELDEDIKNMRATDDPYGTYRDMYLKGRRNEIEALHGRGPLAKGSTSYGAFVKPVGDAAPASPALPAPIATQPETPAQAAQPALPPVFISEPVIQPLPGN